MSKSKTNGKKRGRRRRLWSVPRIRHPAHPGIVVRITELRPGGDLFVCRMVDGRQRMASLGCARADLGATEREQEDAARARAFEVIEALARGGSLKGGGASSAGSPPEPGEVVTLGALADLHAAHGMHGRSERYRREMPRKIRRVVEIIGADRDVRSLSRTDVERFAARRRAEGVRTGTVASDLAALKIALNWAAEHRRSDGEPLIEHNPLARAKIERERRPRRPVATEERYRALRKAAADLPPAFALALDLVWATGHRIGAVLALRWRDVILEPERAAALARELDPEVTWTAEHFPHGGIRWYAGTTADTKKHDHVAPMSPLARAALDRARPDIVPGERWIFPAPKDPARPIGYHVMKRWMERAEEAAGLEHLPGGAWHPFRRGWATARKHLPSGDVAKAGGWRDEATMRRCYLRPDAGTILAAVNGGA